jgi:hypothetical protein
MKLQRVGGPGLKSRLGPPTQHSSAQFHRLAIEGSDGVTPKVGYGGLLSSSPFSQELIEDRLFRTAVLKCSRSGSLWVVLGPTLFGFSSSSHGLPTVRQRIRQTRLLGSAISRYAVAFRGLILTQRLGSDDSARRSAENSIYVRPPVLRSMAGYRLSNN